MKNSSKIIIGFGVVAAFAAGLALEVPLGTLLLVGALLLCPAAMYFGMMGMQQGCGHGAQCNHSEADAERESIKEERPKTA